MRLIIFTGILLLLCGFSQADTYDYAIMTIAYEGSNQSFDGQVAIASVIKTRMFQKHQTADDVILAPYQFSCWHPVTHNPTQGRKLSARELIVAQRAWEVARIGRYNHYARHDIKPYWAKSTKSSIRIGDHIFYEL